MESLPTEVLLYIFEHLQQPLTPWSPVNNGIQDLAQVCLTSRRFQDIATPILYRKIDLYSPRKVKGLLEACVLRPDLMKNIKSIRRQRYIRSHDWEYEDDQTVPVFLRTDGNIFTKDLPPALERIFNKIQSNEEDVVARLSYGDDLLFALLIFILPQLKELSCMLPASFWLLGLGQPTEGVEIRPLAGVDTFEHLRVLCINMTDPKILDGEVSCLFRLPTLRDLTLTNYGRASLPTDEEGHYPEKVNNIERLTFIHSYCAALVIKKAIKSCKALKMFHYSGTAESWSSSSVTHYTIISSALRDHVNTLHTVVLHGFQAGFHTITYDRIVHASAFLNVEIFEILYYILVGKDTVPHASIQELVPPKVTHLQLAIPQEKIWEVSQRQFEWFFLGLYAARKAGQFPYLKAINLRYSETLSANLDLGLDTKKLRDMFLACNISFDVCVCISDIGGEHHIIKEAKKIFPFEDTYRINKIGGNRRIREAGTAPRIASRFLGVAF